MPVVSLRFKLPEEKEDMEMALKAFNYKNTLDELDKFLRNKIKYTDELTINLEEMRETLYRIMRENDL